MSLFNNIIKSQDNSKIVAVNTFYAFIIKGAALAVSFFSTPAFIKYFNNNEILGLWYTLLSMLTWFLTFDLGIGNGIRNHLVKAIAANDRLEIRKIISSGFASVLSVTFILLVIGIVIISSLNLNSIFNISTDKISHSTLYYSAILIFVSIMLRFLLTTVSSIYYALQKSAINNFLSLCVSLFLFLYVIIFHFENSETALINISLAYLIICNLPIGIAGIIVFYTYLKDCRPHHKYITYKTTHKIMGIGMMFFFCQIFYLIIANTNEFFVSHFWNPLDTADYSFYYKITLLISMMVSLALTPTWSMITKAYAESNYSWLIKLYTVFKRIGIIIIMIQFLIVPFMQPIMNIWLGKGELIVESSKSIAFACFGATFIYSSMLSTIVCGLAKMKLQFCCYGIGAIAKIIFIIIIAKYSEDWAWVVWSNVLVLTPYCLLQQISLNHLFSKLKYIMP